MRASDVQAYLRSLNGGWVNPEKTVDTFKSGNPEAEVSGIAVSWMSTMAALRQALALDCNVFITHEPTYYNHLDNQDPRDLVWALPGVREKRDFIAAHDLIVLRCHDLWDQIPGIGIPDAWGRLWGWVKLWLAKDTIVFTVWLGARRAMWRARWQHAQQLLGRRLCSSLGIQRRQ